MLAAGLGDSDESWPVPDRALTGPPGYQWVTSAYELSSLS